jgi:hypothetical protein
MIRDVASWNSLKEGWDEVLRSSEANALFLTWDWLDTWLSIYGAGGQWLILVAENDDGRIEGVAPMMIDRGHRIPGCWIRRLLLLGQKADTASEYLDWILRRGSEEAVAIAFCAAILGELSSEWDLLEFHSMREESVSIPHIRKAFEEHGIEVAIKRLTTAPYVSLPPTWGEFLARRSSTFRQRWKKFHREHQVVVRRVGRDFTVTEGMHQIRLLNSLRWGDQRQSFLSADYVRFHDQVANRFHQLGQLLLVLLEIDGQVVAGRYDFAYAGKGWCFQGGWLPEMEKLRPGRMMMAYQMMHCIEHKLHEYDFLGGHASYKGEWSEGERGIVNLQSRNPSSWRGRLFEAAKAIRQCLLPRK